MKNGRNLLHCVELVSVGVFGGDCRYLGVICNPTMNQNRYCRRCGASGALGVYCDVCEYMTPKQAARRLHVSESTYFRIVASGALHHRRVGLKKVLVSRVEVDNLLSGSRF